MSLAGPLPTFSPSFVNSLISEELFCSFSEYALVEVRFRSRISPSFLSHVLQLSLNFVEYVVLHLFVLAVARARAILLAATISYTLLPSHV